MMGLAFMLSRLVNTQKQVDDQLSLRIQEIVCKMTFYWGENFRDSTLENVFLFVQIRVMSFRSTILKRYLISMNYIYWFKFFPNRWSWRNITELWYYTKCLKLFFEDVEGCKAHSFICTIQWVYTVEPNNTSLNLNLIFLVRQSLPYAGKYSHFFDDRSHHVMKRVHK